MKTVKKLGFQGDVAFVRLSKKPTVGAELPKNGGRLVVAHSETGHHHVLDGEARMFEAAGRDPLVCFLRIDGEVGQVLHLRPFDTHETVGLGKGWWKVIRQREYVPEGWRRVLD